MIYKLRTSKKTEDIFAELVRRTSFKPYTLVKHAIAWSIRDGGKITQFDTDTDGLELNRQTITAEYDDYFRVLMEEAEGRKLSNDEFFPKYVKAHIDRGAVYLLSRYNHAGSVEKYVLETLGVGDTV